MKAYFIKCETENGNICYITKGDIKKTARIIRNVADLKYNDGYDTEKEAKKIRTRHQNELEKELKNNPWTQKCIYTIIEKEY